MTPALQAVLFGGFYPGAPLGLNFVAGRYRAGSGGGYTPDFSAVPGVTFTRALAAYGQTASGALILFGSGVPRITDRGFLPEAAATNLAKQSGDISNAQWTKAAATVTANATAAPDGTLTAGAVVPNAGSVSPNIANSVAAGVSGSTAYVFSMYLKVGALSATWVEIDSNDSVAGTVRTWVNLATGALGTNNNASATVTAVANGFYRVAIGFTTGAGVTAENPKISLRSADNSTAAITGDGAAVGFYGWGAQLEAAASASAVTSYIPTTTAAVTRPADALSIAFTPNGSSAVVTYGTSFTASPAAVSPLNLGASSGGAWVGSYVKTAVVAV